LIYAAPIWYSPPGTIEYRKIHSKKLKSIQNKGLRIITGAFKATNISVLQAEAGIPPVYFYLNRLVLMALSKYSIHEAIKIGTRKIRQRLTKQSDPKKTETKTPAQKKLKWAKEIMPEQILSKIQTKPLLFRIRTWLKDKWKKEWAKFIDNQRAPYNCGPFICGDLLGRDAFYVQFIKAKNSIAI